jgi:hypothetical protein
MKGRSVPGSVGIDRHAFHDEEFRDLNVLGEPVSVGDAHHRRYAVRRVGQRVGSGVEKSPYQGSGTPASCRCEERTSLNEPFRFCSRIEELPQADKVIIQDRVANRKQPTSLWFVRVGAVFKELAYGAVVSQLDGLG